MVLDFFPKEKNKNFGGPDKFILEPLFKPMCLSNFFLMVSAIPFRQSVTLTKPKLEVSAFLFSGSEWV